MDFSGIEKLSLVDFDTNMACTLFMAGCNFRCPFCHNSDLVLNPKEAPRIPFEDILNYLKERRRVLDAVCITGGEPTLMPDLKEKIKAIKDLGYLVKLDTNGTNPKVVKDLVKSHLIDYVAMDIKNSKRKYAKTVGLEELDLSKIEETIKYLMNSGIRYEFRTTITKENHTLEDMVEIGEWLNGASHYYLQHFVNNEHCINAEGLHEVTKEEAERFKEKIKNNFGECSLRGY